MTGIVRAGTIGEIVTEYTAFYIDRTVVTVDSTAVSANSISKQVSVIDRDCS